MKARGADVTITEDSIDITRSELARNLWRDESIPAADLIGWYKSLPDDLTPGHIELLTDSSRVLINFSAGQQEDFAAINAVLTQLQAGYPLDEQAAQEDASPSVSEWVEDVSQQAAQEESSSAGGARRSPAPWAKVATPDVAPEPNPDADIDHPLFGQVICVTGDVEPYSKGDVWNMIADHGASVSKSVTKKTTMLIVGEWATVTSKEKRAKELQAKGQDIAIVSFEEFLKLV